MSMKYLGDRFDIHTGGDGPAVPPPRGRDRAVRGRRRPPGGERLGARRAPAPGRSEDREVHRQRRARPRAGGARAWTRSALPLAHVPDALPQRDGLQLGRDGRRRPPREAAPPAHGEWAPDPGTAASSRATPRRRSTTGSARPSPTTSTCRRRSSIVNELDHSADVADGEKYALLASWDRVLGLDLEREARSTWEPTAEMRELMARARRGPRRQGLRGRRRPPRPSSRPWASRSWTRPRARGCARARPETSTRP